MRIDFDEKKLEHQLKDIAGSKVFYRGQAYFDQGSVGKIRISAIGNSDKIKIRAIVEGGDLYDTSILFNLKTNTFTRPDCDCPYDWGDCKHGVALGLKFIAHYGKLAKRMDDFADVSEVREALTGSVVKRRGSTHTATIIDGTDEEYGKDEEYSDEDGADEKNYREAEIVDPDAPEKDEKNIASEVFQRLLSIGIDAAKIPPHIIRELEKSVLKKEILIGAKTKEELHRKDISKKYCLILDTSYMPRLDIQRKDRAYYGHWDSAPREVLRQEKRNLTGVQKELLELLESIHFWHDEKIDWGKIFDLVKKSGFLFYVQKKSTQKELTFTDNPVKISVEIFRHETENYFNYEKPLPQTDFALRLRGEFHKKNSAFSFCGRNHLVLIRENLIELHPLSEKLSGILSRIMKDGQEYSTRYSYGYSGKEETFDWKTDLLDEEVIAINEILEDARRCFALTTDFPDRLEVKAFEKIGPAFVVEYDGVNSHLRVRAAVDYGFEKIDVAQTVYKSLKGGVVSFQKNTFRNREKFHLRISGNEIHYARIDPKAERTLFEKIHRDDSFGFTKSLRCVRDNAQKIAHFHKHHWPHLKDLGYPVEFSHDEFNFSEEKFTADFKVDMNAENDWLAFDVACYCGKDRISLEDLKKYIGNKEEFIRMNDGRMFKIANWEELERFVLMLESFYEKENGTFEGRAYHAPELQNFFVNSEYYSAQVAEGFKKFIKEAQSGRPVRKVKIPSSIDKTLRDYQKDGIHWFHFLRKYRFAGILADDMGLGKTLQALTLLSMNKSDGKPSLVVCPKTLLFNWEQEAAKFFPRLKVLLIEGSPIERAKSINDLKKYDLVVTSYSTLKKDREIYEKKKIRFDYCFLDEAQFIKNHKTQNAVAVKKIDADYKLALTGTPLENSVSEIWSIFEYLMPGFLGNYSHFTKRFLTPIMKKNNAEALQELRRKTECFMLRRTKSEVLKELPPKIEQVVSCELEEAQNILYKEILANVKADIFKTVKEKGFKKSQIHILAGLMKLRQVCNHPTLLLKNKDYTKYTSAKLESFEEIIGEIVSSGRKVLVFSQFTGMLDILEKVLMKEKIEHLYLSGKTRNRKELVEKFNRDPNIKVFLISLRAGGTGLNLTAADNVIIFDPWWNPSVENQAIDRTHRIGQKNSVNVYRLITKGTIEEKIVKLQEKKKFLFDNLVGESKDLFRKLTWEDVKELFR